MTDLTITETKEVWVVYTNTDLTEGRGHQYPIHVCGSPATAARMAIRKGVQGSDAHVHKEIAVKVRGSWLAPVDIIEPNDADRRADALNAQCRAPAGDGQGPGRWPDGRRNQNAGGCMNEHTKGLLRVGHSGAVVADHPVPEMSGSDAVEYYGGHLVAESVTAANARRLAACWNACLGLPTDELEQRGLASAFGNQLLHAERQRDVLLEALNGVLGVMNNSQGVAGWHQNGAIATWDELLPEVATALEFVEGEQS